MPFVVDASVAAGWVLPYEDDPLAWAAFARLQRDVAVVPSIWWYEIRNILVIKERSRRIALDQMQRGLQLLAKSSIRIDGFPDEVSLMWLARRHRLTVYDAAYLELALRGGHPLATLDAELAAAARAEGAELIAAST